MSRSCVLTLTCLGLLASVSGARQDSTDLFNLSNTGLDLKAGRKVAVDLVEYAQGKCKAAPDYHIMGDYRKLIRVAYQLAPEEQPVISAHARIMKGLSPDAPKKEVVPAALVAEVVALARQAQKGQSQDDTKAARYLFSVGLMIEPQNDVCLIQWEALQKKGGDLPWDKALGVYRRTVPDGHTSSIYGLVVMSSGTAKVGAVSRILLTYKSAAAPSLQVKFLREGGGMMVVSMDEAIRYWKRLEKNVALPGGTLEISFEDKFTKKDGPSAGAAYTVLMRSFSDPFQVDPAFAMTGDISVEGRILKIGGAFAKVRGALQGKCVRAGIPASNEGELTDAVVINGPTTLAEIEIYGMEMIEDAVALARTDKDPRIEKATALFGGLLPLVKKRLEIKDPKSPDIAKITAEVQKIAAEILMAAPRHLSAKLLEAWAGGKLPATLTLASSLDEPNDIFFKFLITISAKGVPSFGDIANEQNSTRISATLKELRDVKPKLHPDAVKPSQKLEEVCGAISRFIAARPDIEEREKRIQSYRKKIDDLKFKIEKAKADQKPVDEINRLVKQHNDAVEDHKNAVDRYNKAVAERNDTFQKVLQLYSDYSAMMKALTQDPALLEKLIHGK